MKNRITVRNATWVAAFAAVAATAWATSESLSNSTWVPAPAAAADTITPMRDTETVVRDEDEIVTATEPLQPAERVMPLEAASIPSLPAARVEESHATQPPITVEERHLTVDERIQADVIDRIAQAPNLSGKIGVESNDAVVTLSGWTTTAGQAQRAARYAGSVEGVRYVQNEIRPRLGGSI